MPDWLVDKVEEYAEARGLSFDEAAGVLAEIGMEDVRRELRRQMTARQPR